MMAKPERWALAAAAVALAFVPAVADEFYVVLFTKILVLGIFPMFLLDWMQPSIGKWIATLGG